MTRGSDNHWTYQILKEYYEESSYETEHQSCDRVEEERGYDEKEP
jgi:hypothetical protein